MPRYRITVNRHMLEHSAPGDDVQPVRVTHVPSGVTRDVREVALSGNVRVVYGDPQQDGARVWIEAEHAVEVKR